MTVLKTRYIDLKDVTFEWSRYHDGVPALIAHGTWPDGEPESLVVSVNCSAYGVDTLVIPGYSEHEGLPEALQRLGVVELIAPVAIGYGSGWLAKEVDRRA